jgi:SAM-dependent methyltransferase
MYLAANVSNPILAPFLLFAELQVGAWLRHGRIHPLKIETVKATSPWSFGLDLVIGSLAVGGVLAVVAALFTYPVVRRGDEDALFARLVRQASDRYVESSLTAWEFARGKLRGDPIYRSSLDDRLLPSGETLVDVGCGQGLMLALLIEARGLVRASSWPPARALPPQFDRLIGIETRSRMARLARSALGVEARIERADARTIELERCSAVLLFDVLHMMSKEEQQGLLSKVAGALTAGGVILVREADSAAGWRFLVVRSVNRLKALAQGSWRQRFSYRTRDQWLSCFAALGLRVDPRSMPAANALGNVLFRLSR